ncbi:hypothetical protein [Williamsia muralis]|uniref:hypothetical protein n=1 Tax=Williamsia marianensis TaxID=85044 RepID=UPI001FE86DF3|nr:hypothetical protein [Williamsia muralis]
MAATKGVRPSASLTSSAGSGLGVDAGGAGGGVVEMADGRVVDGSVLSARGDSDVAVHAAHKRIRHPAVADSARRRREGEDATAPTS